MSAIKRWIITGLSFGAGFAITLAIIIGLFIWHENKPKPWDTKAITSIYDTADIEGDNSTFVFYYTLQNNTDKDYTINDASDFVLLSKLKRQNSLSGTNTQDLLKIDTPILLPAKQRLRFAIHLGYPYENKSIVGPTKEDKEKFRKEIGLYLQKEIPNLNGYVLFDKTNRYQINFNRGW